MLLSALLFAAVVWPTAWRYDRMNTGPRSYPVRTNRFTGAVQVLYPDSKRWEDP